MTWSTCNLEDPRNGRGRRGWCTGKNVKFKFLAREGGEGSKALRVPLIEERGARRYTMIKWLGRGEENRRRNEWEEMERGKG